MYSFAPMLPFYRKLSGAPMAFFQSSEGRLVLAKTFRLCREKHGRAQAVEFRNALTVATCSDIPSIQF